MFKYHSEFEKQQYIKLMEEIKDQNYKLRKFSKKKIPSLKELLKERLHLVPVQNWSMEVPERKRIEVDYFSEDRIAIYTCIIGAYDEILEPVFIPDNCDFYLITD